MINGYRAQSSSSRTMRKTFYDSFILNIKPLCTHTNILTWLDDDDDEKRKEIVEANEEEARKVQD